MEIIEFVLGFVLELALVLLVHWGFGSFYYNLGVRSITDSVKAAVARGDSLDAPSPEVDKILRRAYSYKNIAFAPFVFLLACAIVGFAIGSLI